MKRAVVFTFVSLFIISISACTSTQLSKNSSEVEKHSEILFNEYLFTGYKAPLVLSDDLFSLTLLQQDEILTAVKKKQQQGFKLHQALSEVLKSKFVNFTYYGETYNAETAMRLNKGNCMSLAVLTTAYAKLLGLKFSYREVNTLPVFEKQKNVIISSSHVQTIIYDADYTAQSAKYYFSKPGVVIDYFPSTSNRVGKYFGESDFIAMYYKNLAGDALIEDDLAKAFMLAKKAYQHNKNNVEVINSLAIIHRRAGDSESAEAIYQAGLKIEQSNLRLLSNYIMLLKRQSRFEEAEKYQVKLNQLNDPNPFFWLEEAYIAEKNNEMNKATRFYLKALNQAPYLHQAYLGLYHIYRNNGRFTKAKHMLKEALEWTYEIEQRKQYKTKLYSLAQR